MTRAQSIIEAATSGPKLFPGFPKANVKGMEGGLGSLRSWKVKVVLGAHLKSGYVKPGSWDRPGYIMVDPVKGLIVPEASVDAHRTGYELLWEWQKKLRAIDPRAFLPVWSFGSNYYSRDTVEKWKLVAKKWLEWGGEDMLLQDYDGGAATTFSEFAEGRVTRGEDTPITRLGQKIVDAFKAASSISQVGDTIAVHSQAIGRLRAVSALLSLLERWAIHPASLVDYDKLKQAQQTLAEAEASGETGPLEQALFGFGGVKRQMHDNLRQMAAHVPKKGYDPNARGVAAVSSLFGDPRALVAALDSI